MALMKMGVYCHPLEEQITLELKVFKTFISADVLNTLITHLNHTKYKYLGQNDFMFLLMILKVSTYLPSTFSSCISSYNTS